MESNDAAATADQSSPTRSIGARHEDNGAVAPGLPQNDVLESTRRTPSQIRAYKTKSDFTNGYKPSLKNIFGAVGCPHTNFL